MATPYLTIATLSQLIGSSVVDDATATGSLDVQQVIDSQCALADGYVAMQLDLPPSAAVIGQLAPIVAELCYCALVANANSDAVLERKKLALKQLESIANGKLQLIATPIVDDPATREDESAGVFFSSRRPIWPYPRAR